jgi:hypothetical protein
MRIRILELLRQGPLSVGQPQEVGAPASSISQQLAALRAGIVATQRRHISHRTVRSGPVRRFDVRGGPTATCRTRSICLPGGPVPAGRE